MIKTKLIDIVLVVLLIVGLLVCEHMVLTGGPAPQHPGVKIIQGTVYLNDNPAMAGLVDVNIALYSQGSYIDPTVRMQTNDDGAFALTVPSYMDHYVVAITDQYAIDPYSGGFRILYTSKMLPIDGKPIIIHARNDGR